MRLLAAALFCALLASGQTQIPASEWEPPLPVRKANPRAIGKQLQPAHIHPFGDECKGAANGIYMKSGNTYFACMNGKAVCSDEKGAIPQKYIQDFDRSRAESNARIEEFKGSRRIAQTQPTRTQAPRAARTARSKHSVGVEQAPPAPPSEAVEEERVRALAAGATMDEVLAQFGEPYARLSGEYERITYRLTSGGSARLDFEKGKLAKTQFVPAPRMP